MPWTDETKVEQRFRFVLQVREENQSVAAACREAGISRTTGYKWLDRYDEDGLEGLENRSRAPDTIPHKTDEETEQMICALREQHPQFGPKKLKAWLAREHPEADWPASSTIGNILKRNGLVEPRTTSSKAPPATDPLAEADEPDRLWSADFKGQFELRDGAMCYPLTVTDNYSRMILACKALPSTAGQPVRKRFEQLFERRGLPDAIRTDNGAPFASTAPSGLTRLSAWWRALGIVHERIEPGKPQQNSRHERMHLTLKESATRPAEDNLEAQQERFDKFRLFFNQLRPHESHDQQTPSSKYKSDTCDFYDDTKQLRYPTCDITRSVHADGTIQFAGESIYVTEALREHHVGLTEADVDVWVVSFAGVDIGLFEPGDQSMTAINNPESASRNTL